MFTPPPHIEQMPVNLAQALAALGNNAKLLNTVVQLVIDHSFIDMDGAM